jgi:hypothetical protein
MAKVKEVKLTFPASGSPDVVSYALYMVPELDVVDAVDDNGNYIAQKWDLGMNTTDIDLSILPGMLTNDGVYNLGVTAVDDAGNESSMSVMVSVPLDFVAPDAPGPLTLTRI